MNSSTKYIALVFELPALMLILGYTFNYFDGAQQTFGGWGILIGLMLAMVVWIIHIVVMMKKSEND